MRLSQVIKQLFNPQPVFVFHHIPKCAGTSLKEAFRGHFQLIPDYLKLEMLSNEQPIHPKRKLSNSRRQIILCGHFELPKNHLHIRYPEVLKKPKKFKLFTILRDPLHLRISLYYYELKKKRRDPNGETLEEYLLTQPNYISRILPCSENNYESILARYHFIGIQEYMDESARKLSDFLNRKLEIPVANTSKKDEQVKKLSNVTVKRFKEINSLDYAVYEYALNKFFSD